MTIALFGILACVCLLALMVMSDHLRKLVVIGERIATALERERDPIAKMIGALKDIKATADAEVVRRKAAEVKRQSEDVKRWAEAQSSRTVQ